MQKGFLRTMIFFLITGMVVVNSSCKKEAPATCSNGLKDSDETWVDCGGSCKSCGDLTGKIKTFTTYGSGTSHVYSIGYDDYGRFSFIAVDRDTSFYSYAPGLLIKRVMGEETFFLNAQGMIDSAHFGGQIHRYNNEGYLILAIVNMDTTRYLYSNGNLVQAVFISPNFPFHNDTMDVTYYSEIENRNFESDNTLGLSGGPFHGRTSKNLKKEAVPRSGGLISRYSYEFDAEKRVSKQTISLVGSAHEFITTYTYY